MVDTNGTRPNAAGTAITDPNHPQPQGNAGGYGGRSHGSQTDSGGGEVV